jgi:hypothetical protein
MCIAYLADVQEAILAANKNFEQRIEGEIKQHFDRATVVVMFRINGNRWDYGHPAMYKMEKQHVGELTKWWKEIHPSGDVLKPEIKPDFGCEVVNVQWVSGSGRLFNYHVALKDSSADGSLKV